MTPLALDIFIGLIIFVSALAAYLRGIIKEVFTLLGLVVATMVSYQGGHVLVPEFNKLLHVPDGVDKSKADLILGLLSPSMTAKLLAYGGTFFFIFLLMILIGMLMTHMVKEVGLGIVNRVLGGAFGFLRGFLLVFVLYVPAVYLIGPEKFPDWAKESHSVPVLQSTLAWVNKTLDLNKNIENRGDGIAIKFDKIDIDKLGAQVAPAEAELKKEIKKEEKEIQKGVSNMMAPAPAPLVLPAIQPEPPSPPPAITAPPMPSAPAASPVISPALPAPAAPPQ